MKYGKGMENGMEDIQYGMEWKILEYGMEWKILIGMEYGKFSFHSIP